MFEEFTEEYFMEQARQMGEELGVDTRQGSVYMDAATGHCIRIAKFMSDLSMAFEMLAVDTCSGDILTEKAAQDGIHRQSATPSYYEVSFEGTVPDTGSRLFIDGYYFKLVNGGERYLLESEIVGNETNNFSPGENVVPVYNVDGLNSCTLGELYIPGDAEESDDDLRQRWQEHRSGPSTNGNTSQYRTWCESIEGVGRAHILPLYGGENTVKAVIYSTTGEMPASSILENVQEYIDPIVEGYTVTVNGQSITFGDGLGNGVAHIGAHFLASAPEAVNINISFTADLKSGYSKSQAETAVLKAVKEYIATVVLDGSEDIVVRISSIGSIISRIEAILDYTPASLRINGGSENILIGKEKAPIIKGVSINA